MAAHQMLSRTTAIFSSLLLAALVSNPAAAHCDSMGGPVVKDVQTALAGEKIDSFLKWVGKDDETAIREALKNAFQTLTVSARWPISRSSKAENM